MAPEMKEYNDIGALMDPKSRCVKDKEAIKRDHNLTLGVSD